MQLRYVVPLLLVALSLATTACKKPPEVTPAPPVDDSRPGDRTVPPPRPAEDDDDQEGFPSEVPSTENLDLSIDELNDSGVLAPIYFGYDSFDLDGTSLSTLRANAEWLKAHPEREVVAQGHCDERGTVDYNLALGERRARAVREHLVSLGVRSGQLRIVSFGEERPADPGRSESAWARNRRCEFVIER